MKTILIKLAQENHKKIAELAILLPLVQVFFFFSAVLSGENRDGLDVINLNLSLSIKTKL